jgi:hypothetical protein
MGLQATQSNICTPSTLVGSWYLENYFYHYIITHNITMSHTQTSSCYFHWHQHILFANIIIIITVISFIIVKIPWSLFYYHIVLSITLPMQMLCYYNIVVYLSPLKFQKIVVFIIYFTIKIIFFYYYLNLLMWFNYYFYYCILTPFIFAEIFIKK